MRGVNADYERSRKKAMTSMLPTSPLEESQPGETPPRLAEETEASPEAASVSARTAFWDGVRAVAPLFLGVLPFGAIAGAAAVSVGLDAAPALALSVIVFAGASQLAMLELLSQNAPWFVILATAMAINARFTIYSLSLAPRFQHLGRRAKALAAYLLTDQAYAVSIVHYDRGAGPKAGKCFYFGAAASLWVVWLAGTALGVGFGAEAAARGPFQFAVPLTFLALLVPSLKNRPTVFAAAVSGLTVLALHALPLNLGFLAAVFAGAAAGVWAERRRT